MNDMKRTTELGNNDIDTLAEDAHALLTATADVAGEKIGEARKRLATALERGNEIYGRIREKTVEGAKAADVVVHQHPYAAIGIAVGVGALFGFLLTRRNRD